VTDTTVEVLTVGEVAQYLRIPVSSVYKLAQDGRIPCRKVGRQWRFIRPAIDEWLGQRGSAGLGAEAGMREVR
jgi:excisionase family DNA binding protein